MKCYESLVPRRDSANALSVSPTVNTKAYHDAFEEMPLPRRVSQSVYEQVGRILRLTDGTEFEHMAAVNARTGAVVTDNLGRKPRRLKTGFNAVEMRKVESCADRVVIVHNHPASKPPSFRDVHTVAMHDRIAASVVAGYDGSLWYVVVDDATVAVGLASLYNDFKDSKGDFAEVKALDALLEDRKMRKLFKLRRLR